MSNSRDLASRLRQGLNPLLTSSLGGYQNQVGTPLSAISISTHAYSTNQTTPSSAIQPYNPQQWVASPAVGPERTHQFSAGPEASPLPPPPYSPPRSQRPVSQVFESPAIQVSRPQTQLRPSPDPPAQPNPIFPPPPGASGRGASRERSRFLPSLGRRKETTQETVAPPEPHPSASRPGLRVVIPQDAAVPPNARRAASTPAIGTPTSSRSRSSSQIRWDPMTMGSVPPPPPGPPPSQSRSQSVSRTTDLGRHPEMTLSPPTRRPPPGGVSALGPVPPTPANWVDSDRPQMSRSRSPSGMETPSISNSIVGSPSTALDSAATGSPEQVSSGTLARARAVRGEKSLRERRAESRSRHTSHGSIDATLEHQLSDIVIPNGPGLTRRLTITRSTPRSSRSSVEVPRNGDQADQHHSQAVASSTSTPRAQGSAASHHPETPTPPFSPHPKKPYAMAEPSPSIAPKALPTPPPQNRSVSQTRRASSRASSVDIRSGPPSPKLTRQAVVNQTPDQFCMATVERFQRFAQKEANAASDAERVRLFAEFMVSESRIRRERYAQAIGAMGSEIFDLTRDLFRPMVGRRESTGSQAGEMASQRSDSRVRDLGHSSSSVPSSAGIESSPVAGSSGPGNNWNSNNFMPSLSPILSMSVSEHHDENSSRGRPASRWWETDSSGRGSMRIERSKRESKYMGVTLESWTEPEAGPSSYQNSTEYPPEKVGWHEPEPSTTPQTLRSSMLSNAASSPNTPSAIRSNSNPHALDVSRLVTLPPPYPRHHPAVNNNHPNLTSIRNQVRQLSDFTEVEQTKSRFKADSDKAREEAATAAAQRKASLRTNLQQEIASGNMSYAEAAAIEADAMQSERSIEKELSKKDFDAFQHQVIMPLNDLLVGRIAQATSLFDELRSRLFEEHRNNNPDMPQEEGDETPELLEKLTLLKWIFEARESLHRAIYDLLSDRNDRYRDMIITPYKLAGNEEKLRNAQAFFADDAQKRAVTFAEESLKRSQEFQDVVEENVVRGVEVQLSAFWDIAPPLKRVLDKIPADVGHGFSIQIPPSEYEENPAYHQHPMQYLYSLLLHAEKSTYQFIESQTNLLCLLHEVKETVTLAKAKVMTEEARDEDRVKEVKAEEEARLTEDLKEKVRVVGDQWADALGEAFSSVKERVGEWLLQTGGWDETLEDGGVGAP